MRVSELISFLVLTTFGGQSVADSKALPVEFNRDIRPILADNCYACHGPDEQQRKGAEGEGMRLDVEEGAFADLGGRFAIVRGDPENSELVRRIHSTDPDEMMPPADHRKRLSDRDKQLLTEWVRQGAPWSGHWAWVLPQRREIPMVRDRKLLRPRLNSFLTASSS